MRGPIFERVCAEFARVQRIYLVDPTGERKDLDLPAYRRFLEQVPPREQKRWDRFLSLATAESVSRVRKGRS